MAFQGWILAVAVSSLTAIVLFWRLNGLSKELSALRERSDLGHEALRRDVEICKTGLDLDATTLDALRRSVANLEGGRASFDARVKELAAKVNLASKSVVSLTGEVAELGATVATRASSDAKAFERSEAAVRALRTQHRRLAAAADTLSTRVGAQDDRVAEVEKSIAAIAQLSESVRENMVSYVTIVQLAELEAKLDATIAASKAELSSSLSVDKEDVATRLNAFDEQLTGLRASLTDTISAAIRDEYANSEFAAERARTIELVDQLDRLISDPVARRRLELAGLPSMRSIEPKE